MYSLVVKELAKNEIVNIASNYEDIQENLGYKFSEAVEIALRDIKINPLGYQIKYQAYRTKIIKPFPCIFIFEVIKHEVVVYQCFFGKDNPLKLYKKK